MDKTMAVALQNIREKKRMAGRLALAIETLTPNTGSTAGGTTVVILGTGFNGQSVVKFDTGLATNIVTLDSRRIQCKTPAHAAGAVTVTVTQGLQTAAKTGAYTYA
jgi:hypothetical protein